MNLSASDSTDQRTTTDTLHSRFGNLGTFQSLITRRGSSSITAAEADMERRVSMSARNFGEEVQQTIRVAKNRDSSQSNGSSGSSNVWKSKLLYILGGSDVDVEKKAGQSQKSDIDVLLANSSCEKFVLRCMENSVPPNLIHCLRLLRVLELQIAHTYATQKRHNEIDATDSVATPVSISAAGNLVDLLCLLCTDPSVGEQLRPHFYGLLGLSGASYPPNGVHVARAASKVIVAISERSLNASLVWFLYENQMVIHMTNDVKDLLCISNTSPLAVAKFSLYGEKAETAGLWVTALRSIVYIIKAACAFNCDKILEDFVSCGGYQVLKFAVTNSGGSNVRKILELVAVLVACERSDFQPPVNINCSSFDYSSDFVEETMSNNKNENDDKLASNPSAFEIIANLMVESIPFLTKHRIVQKSTKHFTTDQIQVLSKISIETTVEMHREKKVTSIGSDLISELLVTILHLYSDHSMNYCIIEDHYYSLSQYLLAFPTLIDDGLKVTVLKTLEYVCTAQPGPTTTPLKIASEIFFCLCKTILRLSIDVNEVKENVDIIQSLNADTALLCDTLEKLLQVNDRIAQVMIDVGILGAKLDEFLSLVVASPSRRFEVKNRDNEFTCTRPFIFEGADEAYTALCRILKYVCQSSLFTIPVNARERITSGVDSEYRSCDLNLILSTGITKLGIKSCGAALSVFEFKMGTNYDDNLQQDMLCLVELLDKFCENLYDLRDISTILDLSVSADKKIQIPSCTNSDGISPAKQISKHGLDCLVRSRKILDMLKTVLEVNETAQNTFRISGGFDSLLRLLMCLNGVTVNTLETNIEDGLKDANCQESKTTISLLETIFSVLLVSTTPVKTRETRVRALSTTSLRTTDLLSEEDSTTLSPYAKNRAYIRDKAFYIGLASVIADTGILCKTIHARTVLNLSIGIVDPGLFLPAFEQDEEEYLLFATERTKTNSFIHGNSRLLNPDAIRLVLGICLYLPQTINGSNIGKRAFNVILPLCLIENAATTLDQLASCGLCRSLTNFHEFGFVYDDLDHPFYPLFVTLLKRIASFKMSQSDFVNVLRCIAGPILMLKSYDCISNDDCSILPRTKKIRLPTITSSVSSKKSVDSNWSESFRLREKNLCTRLEILASIAEQGDRVARCLVGGDSLDNIGSTTTEVSIQDTLYALAEKGRIKFIEVDSIGGAEAALSVNSNTNQSGNSSIEKLWSPSSNSGFSYSLWLRLPYQSKNKTGNIFILDLSSPLSNDKENRDKVGFLSLRYENTNQKFSVISSASLDPVSFPKSPLTIGVWHHILMTYQPPKRSSVLLSRKAVVGMCLDGSPLDADIKIDSILLPPTAKMYIGVPNPTLASRGFQGFLPVWEVGSILLFSTILGIPDATSIFAAGPDFNGQFWGDRPERLSLAATASNMFSMLVESGEQGNIADALERRNILEIEGAGHAAKYCPPEGTPVVSLDSDLLTTVGLLCNIQPEYIVCAYRASSSTISMRDGSHSNNKQHYSRRLVNVAKNNSSNENVSTDAIVYGSGSIIAPSCFADDIQWVGGPSILLPIANAACSPSSIALALHLIRESVRLHVPNLESLQTGGGYRMIGLLLRQNQLMDFKVLDQCFAFAVHGFEPCPAVQSIENDVVPDLVFKNNWLFVDIDAMKHLLLNHQVWDIQSSGPALSLRILSFLKGLVDVNSIHAKFNTRRLHLLGIVKWTLHLFLEAAELYTAGSIATGRRGNLVRGFSTSAIESYKKGWYIQPPSDENTSVGGDPGNPVLLACKILLRRVLKFVLTLDDLSAIAGAIIYTVSIDAMHTTVTNNELNEIKESDIESDREHSKLLPGSVARVYLIRLLEELVIDGLNEVFIGNEESNSSDKSHLSSVIRKNGDNDASHSYLASFRRKTLGQDSSNDTTKEKRTQKFLSAFSDILSPVWFASILEGCRDEASAAALIRVLVLMLQNSPHFKSSFVSAGGFAPFVLSIPKFSTSASINLSLLSQLLNAPILHLPCFGILDPDQLCEVFDTQCDSSELSTDHDPPCGDFSLLIECVGRNIQLGSLNTKLGIKARRTNDAVLQLLRRRHSFSCSFQNFCRTTEFLESMAQALCFINDDKLQTLERLNLGLKGYEKIRELSQSPVENENSLRSSGSTNADGLDDEVYVPWPSDDTTSVTTPLSESDVNTNVIPKKVRRGSLVLVDTSSTPTERLVGDKGKIDGAAGIVKLLHQALSHAVLSAPLAAPLINSLFHSFSMHASSEQVEAFYLVLIEQCCSVVENALHLGELIALANCVGVCSTLLNKLMAGFFSSELVLETVKICLFTLKCLSSKGTYASKKLRSEGATELLLEDTMHISRLTCLKALQCSMPVGFHDPGDSDLNKKILHLIGLNLKLLLCTPCSIGRSWKKNQSPFSKGSHEHKLWEAWQSASLSRCCSESINCHYRDSDVQSNPDRFFVVLFMTELEKILDDDDKEVCELAALLVISLLREKPIIMQEILVREIHNADNSVESVDLMNRGGFGALLLQMDTGQNRGSDIFSITRKTKLKFDSYFDWLRRNRIRVTQVLNEIQVESRQLMVESLLSSHGAWTPEETVERQQHAMLLKQTKEDSSDITILGSWARGELAQNFHDTTAENHIKWKQQGFADFISAAVQWKLLLRQLKGSSSIWEGETCFDKNSLSNPKSRFISWIRDRKNHNESKPKNNHTEEKNLKETDDEIATRWKLDLTSGYEMQRRRFLPNYEFHSLYNINEVNDVSVQHDSTNNLPYSHGHNGSLIASYIEKSVENKIGGSTQLLEANLVSSKRNSFVATPALLKIMHASMAQIDHKDYDDSQTEITELNVIIESESPNDFPNTSPETLICETNSVESINKSLHEEDEENSYEIRQEDNLASSYDLLIGLLRKNDKPEKFYNVKKLIGLEVSQSLMIWCRDALYVIDGFEQTDGEGLKGKINRLEKVVSTYDINLRAKDFAEKSNDQEGKVYNVSGTKEEKTKEKDKEQSGTFSSDEFIYQHKCQRIALVDLCSIYRRRYHLQQTALEIFDSHKRGIFISFASSTEREEVLAKVLGSSLPNSIFGSSLISAAASINYSKFMSMQHSKISNQWVQGKMTNFEFIMHLNMLAGRSYNDLTQYPVFPWVLSDYQSKEIDLDDPNVYRDLSKPMGALGEARAQQFKERYESLESNYDNKEEPPPFHYGTHYSCASYVLNYLIRLEPFSRLGLSIQGGHFDIADRLFHDIGASWISASQQNLQDVRELIPEFFYLPEFLENKNLFDFGTTQSGKTVHNVTLPPWSKGDPRRFIRINRQVSLFCSFAINFILFDLSI